MTPELPDWIIAKATAQKTPLKELYKGVSEGGRNDALARLVGSWVNDGLCVDECIENARIVNQKNNPPLEDNELQAVVNSIIKKHFEDKDELVEAVEDVEVFIGNIFPMVGFPLEVFPDHLRRFIKNLSIAYNIPVDVAAAAVLTIISVAIGNSVRVAPKPDWQEPVFIWLMIIGRSGSGKTPFINKLLKPLVNLQREEFKVFSKKLEEYKANEAKYKKILRKKEIVTTVEKEPEKPFLKHYKVSDATIEALADVMRSSPRGVLMFQDELSGFILGFNQYKNKGNDRQKWLEVWNCSPWKIDRVATGSKYIHDTGCGILGGIQPLVLPLIFKDDSIADGLLPRFLFSRIAHESIYTGDSLSWKDEKLWDEIIWKCYALELHKDEFGDNDPLKIKFDQCAADFYKEFKQRYKDQGKYLPEKARVFLPKLESYAVRISGILYILRNQKEGISRQTLDDSIRIVDYFAGQAMAMLTEYGKSNQLSEVDISVIRVLSESKNKILNCKLKLSEIVGPLNSSLPKHLQQSSESISSILSKKLKLRTKLVGGYSYLIWDEAKIDRLCSLHLRKASTTSTTSPDFV